MQDEKICSACQYGDGTGGCAPSRVIANNFSLMMRLVTAGLGPTIAMSDGAQPYIDRGEVVPVLEAYCPPFPGYYL